MVQNPIKKNHKNYHHHKLNITTTSMWSSNRQEQLSLLDIYNQNWALESWLLRRSYESTPQYTPARKLTWIEAPLWRTNMKDRFEGLPCQGHHSLVVWDFIVFPGIEWRSYACMHQVYISGGTVVDASSQTQAQCPHLLHVGKGN